jgi:hypothetical protein
VTTLKAACEQALKAIENGEPFEHLDNVVAPALRSAIALNERKTSKSAAEFSQYDMRGRIMYRLKKQSMTTDELAKDMRAARSTVAAALKELHNKKRICIVRWVRTGSSPMRYWGIGDQDAAKPSTVTPEQKAERKREARRRQKEEQERINQAPNFIPRRDPAAAWF